jgi:uncharacterized membrane protein
VLVQTHKKQQRNHFIKFGSKGIQLMLVVVVLSSIEETLISHLILSFDTITMMTWSKAGLFLGFCFGLISKQLREDLSHSLVNLNHSQWFGILVQQFSRVFSGLLLGEVISQLDSAAWPAVLGSLSFLVVLLLSVKFLKEKLTRQKVIGVILIGCGSCIFVI